MTLPGVPIKRELLFLSGLHPAGELTSLGRPQSTAYISFGGLLMALRGSYRHLQNIVIGENIFLLMRK
jgi:DNA-directed RNA polymerase I, II, and III subunit RPABC3